MIKDIEKEVSLFQETPLYKNKSKGYHSGFVDAVALIKEIIEDMLKDKR